MGVAASLCTSVCRSAHQPRCTEFGHFSSSSSARARPAYIPPTPEMTSSGRPCPLPHPSGGPAAVRSTRSLTSLASGPRGSQLVGQVMKRVFGFQEVARGTRLLLHPSTAPPTCCVSVGKSLAVSGPCVPPMYTEVPANPSAPLHAPSALDASSDLTGWRRARHSGLPQISRRP